MADNQIMSSLELIQGRLEKIETSLTQLDRAVSGYLQWMAENGYSKTTIKNYGKELHRFKVFVRQKKVAHRK